MRRVYDGDTITVDIDLGFGITINSQKVRLLGINTPEIRGASREAGLKSRDELRKQIGNKWVKITTQKDKKGKYGRWLAEVWVGDTNVNEWLLKEGLAEPYPSREKK